MIATRSYAPMAQIQRNAPGFRTRFPRASNADPTRLRRRSNAVSTSRTGGSHADTTRKDRPGRAPCASQGIRTDVSRETSHPAMWNPTAQTRWRERGRGLPRSRCEDARRDVSARPSAASQKLHAERTSMGADRHCEQMFHVKHSAAAVRRGLRRPRGACWRAQDGAREMQGAGARRARRGSTRSRGAGAQGRGSSPGATQAAPRGFPGRRLRASAVRALRRRASSSACRRGTRSRAPRPHRRSRPPIARWAAAPRPRALPKAWRASRGCAA